MPRIPIGQEQQRINPGSPVSIGNTSDARLLGSAVAGVGAGLQDFATQANRVREAQIQVDLDTKKIQLDQAAQIASEEAIRSNEPDKVAHYNKVFQDRVQKIVGDDTSDPVYSRANIYAQRVQTLGETHTQVMVDKENEKKLLDSTQQLLNSHIDQIRNDPTNAAAYMQAGQGTIEKLGASGVVKGDSIVAAGKAFRQDAALALIEGYKNKKQYNAAYRLLTATAQDPNQPPDLSVSLKPSEALAAGFIDQNKFNELVKTGKDYSYQLTDSKGGKLSSEETQLMLSLNPKAKSALIAQVQAHALNDQMMRVGELNARISGMEQSAMNGQPLSTKDINETLGVINAMPGPETHRELLRNKVLLMNETAQAANLMKTMDSSKMQAFLDEKAKAINSTGTGDKFITYGQRQNAIGLMESTAATILKQRMEDGAGAAISSFPDMQASYFASKDGNPQATQSYAAKVLATQSNLGIPQEMQRILPKADALELGKRFKATNDPDMLVALLNDTKGRYGEYSSRVLGEAVKTDRALEPLQLMLLSENPAWQRKISENYLNGKNIREAFKKSQPEGALQNLEVQVGASLGQFNRIMSQAYPDGSASGFYDALVDHGVLETIKTANTGGGSSRTVRNSMEELLSNFQVASGGRSTVIAPATSNGLAVDRNVVEGFLEHYSSPEGIKQLGLKGLGGEREDTKLTQIAAVGKWIPTPDLSGVAFTLAGEVARRADGSQVIYKYSDIMKNPPPKQPAGKKYRFDQLFLGR